MLTGNHPADTSPSLTDSRMLAKREFRTCDGSGRASAKHRQPSEQAPAHEVIKGDGLVANVGGL